MTINQTTAKIISAYVNGWMSRSAAKSALVAIGIPELTAETYLRAAWEVR